MRIFFASPEVVPFAKTGGLADVAGALPKAIRKLGHDIRVFMPRYKKIDPKKWNLRPVVQSIEVELGAQKEKIDVYESKMPGSDLTVYFLENEHFASRDELYMLEGRDYPDNAEAFLAFCKAAIPFLKEINWRPDIVHCNDWQSASISVFVHEQRKSDPFFQRTATVYSIHNMAYQGAFPKDKFSLLGLPDIFLAADSLEAWGKLLLTKAGFVYADVISTVSETYSREIQTKDFGCGLEDLLQKRSKDIYGILNGVDYDLWDPATDQRIVKRYSRMTLSLKVRNKTALQEEMGLPPKDVPLIGMISRLDAQKGFDILADGIEDLMQLECQVVILGTGDPKYHEILQEIKQKYPEHIGIKLGFDAALAQKIYAASDMFLMPSKYEPCGLGQLISFKYGTIPIARKTGGLADTVREFDLESGEGDGFIFEEYNSNALLSAIKKAIGVYKEKSVWKKLQEKVMDYDYSWDASAKKYISLYMKALNKIIN